jgi:hypothetical protein
MKEENSSWLIAIDYQLRAVSLEPRDLNVVATHPEPVEG